MIAMNNNMKLSCLYSIASWNFMDIHIKLCT